MRHQDAPVPVSRIIKYPHAPTHRTTLTPSQTHLFHFSALTFNAHAIHLDPLYARHVDGHRGLLVHGPLTLALMLRVLAAHIGDQVDVKKIVYRNHAPLYVDEPLTVCLRQGQGRKWEVWVEGPEGGLAVRGSADVGEV
ncbi:hypothetical protein G7046_g6756 [Stylonectria norvegica]|nr:hypothetical protein G7046_g6756 [Stylonectria norvegica]